MVDVKRIGFGGEVGDEDVRVAVAIEVLGVHTHAGFRGAAVVEGGKGELRAFPKRAVALIQPQVIGRAVVGDIEVCVAIAIEITCRHAEGGRRDLGEAGGAADVVEAPAAEVAEETVRDRRIGGGGAIAGPPRQVWAVLVRRKGEVEVVGDVEVQSFVAIDVGEACTHGPLGPRQDRVAEFPEASVAQVLEQLVGAVVGEKDVRIAVVVDVAGGDAHAVAVCAHAGCIGDVNKAQTPIPANVAVQPVNGRIAHGSGDFGQALGHRAALHQPDVEQAVAVEVEHADAGPHGFQNPALADHAVDVPEAKPGILRHLAEPRGACGCTTHGCTTRQRARKQRRGQRKGPAQTARGLGW